MNAIPKIMAGAFLLSAVVAAQAGELAVKRYGFSPEVPPDLDEVPPGPAYRFGEYPSAAPSGGTWGYLFGNSYRASDAYNYYAPGYRTGPAFADPPTGSYYQSPCYFEAQQIWDGDRWTVRRTRICR